MEPIRYFGPGEFAKHVEQRMEEHRRLQQRATRALVAEIIEEVHSMPDRNVKLFLQHQQKSGRLFDSLPGDVQASVVTDLEPRQ